MILRTFMISTEVRDLESSHGISKYTRDRLLNRKGAFSLESNNEYQNPVRISQT